MFSLAGVPPLAGFWGKLTLFIGRWASILRRTADAAESLRPWFVGLAIIGVMNAAIAMAYYLRVVAVMYFRSPITTLKAEGGPGALWAMVACTVLVVGLGCYPGPVIRHRRPRRQGLAASATARDQDHSAQRLDWRTRDARPFHPASERA